MKYKITLTTTVQEEINYQVVANSFEEAQELAEQSFDCGCDQDGVRELYRECIDSEITNVWDNSGVGEGDDEELPAF